eukprot:COSAG02_NODE_37665_length_439_cov_0.611765_1_plen_95_part_01
MLAQSLSHTHELVGRGPILFLPAAGANDTQGDRRSGGRQLIAERTWHKLATVYGGQFWHIRQWLVPRVTLFGVGSSSGIKATLETWALTPANNLK